MRIKKIKENFFENLKMNKYDFLVNAINEIGNFPYIMSGIYLNNEKTRSGEYQGLSINIGWNDEDETALYISEYENEIEDIKRVYYKDFLKKLEVIVNAYEDIYTDNGVQKMYKNFKKIF
ncbi:hypothetical protein [Leptotrichia wadei]|nr:hypothetical protein [Leptotrichia wadei]